MLKKYPTAHPYLPFNALNNIQLWLVTDSSTQNMRLIKQLMPGFKAYQFDQFYQEYHVYLALANLTDKKKNYFAHLIDFYQEDGAYFLVLEFYPGQTLKQLIAENRLNFSQKIAVLIDLCQAINAFHGLGFIHCDIKPSNILITQKSLKLLDFGLVQDTWQARTSTILTAGTPAYMSPEQFTGGAVTYQSDYYSFGIILYETFVGKKPFSATTLEDWVIAHCQMPLPSVMQFEPTINQLLQPILNQLLAKFAIYRPKDLSQTIQTLKKLEEY